MACMSTDVNTSNNYICIKNVQLLIIILSILVILLLQILYLLKIITQKIQEKYEPIKHNHYIDKLYWVIAHDVKNLFKRYEKIPCIFVEKTENNFALLRFDKNIDSDSYRYTGWRKVIGIAYGIRVEVLLLKNGNLYDLNGSIVDISSIKRSKHVISKKYLGILDIR